MNKKVMDINSYLKEETKIIVGQPLQNFVTLGLNIDFIKEMKVKVNKDKKEISGCILPKKRLNKKEKGESLGHFYSVVNHESPKIMNGSSVEAHVPTNCLASFHMHPQQVYSKYKLRYAWPSGQDAYEILHEGLTGTRVHVLFSKEGIYWLFPNVKGLAKLKSVSKTIVVNDALNLYQYVYERLQELRNRISVSEFIRVANSLDSINLYKIVNMSNDFTHLQKKRYRSFIETMSRTLTHNDIHDNLLFIKFMSWKKVLSKNAMAKTVMTKKKKFVECTINY